MILTDHALKRWRERCDGLEPLAEWFRSSKCGRKTKAMIRRTCAAHAHLARYDFKGVYYRIAHRSGVIFVVKPGEVVVTVLRKPSPPAKHPRVDADSPVDEHP